jgi:hypothetical protein
MTQTELRRTEGKMMWATADYTTALATAYREAAMAADVISEEKASKEWRLKAAELEARAEQERRKAKGLGYFADDTELVTVGPVGVVPP